MDVKIIGTIISLSIMLMIFVSVVPPIWDNPQIDCSDMTGYNPSSPSSSTGWAETCMNIKAQSQSDGRGEIILIAMPMVAILVTVRMLQ